MLADDSRHPLVLRVTHRELDFYVVFEKNRDPFAYHLYEDFEAEDFWELLEPVLSAILDKNGDLFASGVMLQVLAGCRERMFSKYLDIYQYVCKYYYFGEFK